MRFSHAILGAVLIASSEVKGRPARSARQVVTIRVVTEAR